LVGVEFNAQLDIIEVISEAVFTANHLTDTDGNAENARHELAGHEMWHHVARVKIARHKNARNAIVWNTECCICLSIAKQECMSRQERAPDFGANCVLVND